MEPSPTTNLSEVDADYLRLWQPAARTHVDVRELFVAKSQIVEPTETHVPVGNDEVQAVLEYPSPSNEQVPDLKGLLDYMEQRNPASTINKFYTIHRRQKTELLGDTHVIVRKTVKQVRNVRVHVETYAPTLLQRTRVTQKVTRPIYIFATPY